jgi:hypothetical protein
MKDNNSVISSKINHTYCNQNDYDNDPFIIYHQNIQCLKDKINEFMPSLFPDMPHLIYLSEHHLRHSEIDLVQIPTYNLGAKYYRTTLKCGGAVSIFMKILNFHISTFKNTVRNKIYKLLLSN